jgi:uroporphyrinogen III methyltransferase / synthase
VTHRDYTSDVAIITGHRKEDKRIEIPKAGTLVFLMGVANIGKIVDSLIEAGWSADTKIAAVEHGTCYDQRVITGAIGDFVEKVREAELRTPAVFVAGKVVELREKLDWFSKRPNVLVLGNHPERYRHLGNIVHRRIIDCVPLEDYSKADSVFRDIEQFDWIVFTSVNGAKYLFERLFAIGLDARALSKSRAAAIGATTAERLKEYGIAADIVPAVESSAGLLEEFAKVDMAGKKILLPQALISSEELPEGLRSMKASVVRVPVYQTVDVEPGEIDFDFIDQVLFTSGSTVRAFVRRFGKLPAKVKAYCLGKPTLEEARRHNIEGRLVAGSKCVKEE